MTSAEKSIAEDVFESLRDQAIQNGVGINVEAREWLRDWRDSDFFADRGLSLAQVITIARRVIRRYADVE